LQLAVQLVAQVIGDALRYALGEIPLEEAKDPLNEGDAQKEQHHLQQHVWPILADAHIDHALHELGPHDANPIDAQHASVGNDFLWPESTHVAKGSQKDFHSLLSASVQSCWIHFGNLSQTGQGPVDLLQFFGV